MRKSQGADLAELLSQAGSYDAAFYSRQRVNLAEEYGLPPAHAASFLGLDFDLDALAACLAMLPLHEVLGLSERVGGGDQEMSQHMSQQFGDSNAAGGRSGEQAAGPTPGAEEQQAQQPDSLPPASGPEADGPGEGRAAAPQAAARSEVGRDARLERVEGHTVDPAGPPTSMEGSLVPRDGGGAAPGSERELDFLLGLEAKPGPNAGAAASARASGAGAEESLEEWLDSL